MAGGAPIPVPTSDPDEKILSIADLEKAASKKLDKTARGNTHILVMLDLSVVLLMFSSAVFCLQLRGNIGNVSLISIKQRNVSEESSCIA